MKYCIFAGTFNPVHNAHIEMAKKVLSEFDFDKIIFIPAFIQPLKDKNSCKNTALDRLNMLKSALKNHPDFEINTIEYDKKDISYTYNTILELYKTIPDIEGKIN
ncbi:MAG: adenylyltransferase/cytidyltransferase family protein [Candidatus Gastranaerophilales bacterium]|nr:adenylyltransferase/cytidyltransferase family protein [Candidatus Gastranaerophilales bacterium]